MGQRLVEMLVERGAARVVSFDRAPKPKDALTDERVVYQQGDLCKMEDVERAVEARGPAARRAPRTLAHRDLHRAPTASGTSRRWWDHTLRGRRTTP